MRISAPDVFRSKGTKSGDGEGDGGEGNAGLRACGDLARVTALWVGALSSTQRRMRLALRLLASATAAVEIPGALQVATTSTGGGEMDC